MKKQKLYRAVAEQLSIHLKNQLVEEFIISMAVTIATEVYNLFARDREDNIQFERSLIYCLSKFIIEIDIRNILILRYIVSDFLFCYCVYPRILRGMVIAAEEILSEFVRDYSADIVSLGIKEAVQLHLDQKEKYGSLNPLLRVVFSICDETSDDLAREIAADAILEVRMKVFLNLFLFLHACKCDCTLKTHKCNLT